MSINFIALYVNNASHNKYILNHLLDLIKPIFDKCTNGDGGF